MASALNGQIQRKDLHEDLARIISSHLAALQASIAMEFEKKIEPLEAENRDLRGQLAALAEQPVDEEDHLRTCRNAQADSNHEEGHKSAALDHQPPTRMEECFQHTDAKVCQGPQRQQDIAIEHASQIMCVEKNNAEFKPPMTRKEKTNTCMGNRDQTHLLYASDPDDNFKEPPVQPTVEEVHEGTRFQQLITGVHFELLSATIILTNTIILCLSTQYEGMDNGYEIKFQNYERPAAQIWPFARKAIFISGVFFNAIFTLEILLRVAALRWNAIRSGWMWFDGIIVALGLVDLFTSGKGIGINPGMMRAIRLVRLVRLLKIFQAMSSFDALFLLLKAIHASFSALLWSFLLLLLIQLIVGLFLSQMLKDFIENESNELDARKEVFRYFGTFSRTILTMFEITMANWVPSCRALSEDVTQWFILFFILYRCMFAFAILKVIAAVFITETNRVLAHDDELNRMKRKREKKIYLEKLSKMFKSIDANDDGYMDWDEMQSVLADEQKASWLPTVGFEPNDFEKLFWLIDDGSGTVETEEFLKRTGRLKGEAKTIDMLTLCKLVHRIDQKLSNHDEEQQPVPSQKSQANQDDDDLGGQYSATI